MPAWSAGPLIPLQKALVHQWVSADPNMKKQVKASLLATLGTQVSARPWGSGWRLGVQQAGQCARQTAVDAQRASLAGVAAYRWFTRPDRPWSSVPRHRSFTPLLRHTPRSGAQGDAGHTAALVIAKVAAVEVPRSEWPELISALLANMAATPSTKELRQSTLETLGYTCEVGAAPRQPGAGPAQLRVRTAGAAGAAGQAPRRA